MAALAVASVFGTLIPKLEDAQRIVYYSWWYETLLLLLGVNLVCTTVRTLSERVLPFMRPRFQKDKGVYRGLAPTTQFAYEGDVETAAAAFRKKGFGVAVEKDCGNAWKGKLGRWGSAISHLGFIIVLLGGVASGFVSEEGWVGLREGSWADRMTMRTEQEEVVDLGFILQCDDFDTAFHPDTRIPSNFTSIVAVFDSEGEFLQRGPVEVNQSMKTHGWTLHQTSYKEMPDVTRYRLKVSNPEQSVVNETELSPGQTRPLAGAQDLNLSLGASSPLTWTVRTDEGIVQQGLLEESTGPITLRAERFEPDFIMGSDKKITSRSQDMDNPALLVSLFDGQNKIGSTWLFHRDDMKQMMHGATGPYEMELDGIAGDPVQFTIAILSAGSGVAVGNFTLGLGELQLIEAGKEETANPAAQTDGPWTVEIVERVPAYTTFLTVARNPAIPVIYFGCALMTLGLSAALFISRKEVWFMVDPRRKRLYVAGVYRHPQDEFDSATQSVIDSLGAQQDESAKTKSVLKGEVS